ncbi:cytochrome P450 78A3-like isoform X2 [Gastrolobium bilobum]|uniref:cytochrome P450 78A3-like isoform X2 n=1 Tax=Gastrolobium bilobum TaxID=150636 RepID=UPI002AB2B548|nr:cytochrome P450 78A3-like isoform X2 [Gastrolobium bilobum]
MNTHIDNLCVFALASKCTQENIAWSIFVMASLWLTMTFFHWSHPGGPAWGKYYYYSTWRKTTTNKMIPGPKGYPFIGSMNLMTSLAHHRIAAAAKACRATRLMAFSLGETRAIVTCNPDVAKEILNSSVFADRPIKESAYSLMFNRAIGFAPYGVYWRTLRRIAATHLFCPKQIKASEIQRSEIATQIIHAFTNRHNNNHGSFAVRPVLKEASLNNMMWSVFGQRYKVDEANSGMEELSGLVEQGYDLLGTLNWGDHLPWLKDFDAQKIRFACSELVPKVNRFVGSIIADHRADITQTNMDFVHVLLSLQGPDKLSESDMIAVLWEMIFRGTDTVAVLIEWILARIVLHPEVQEKVQAELDRVIGGGSRDIREEDVTAMVYLPAVVKEVLRLHPPGPLLSWARLAITNTTIDGYHVPAGTTAMVNMWAITRDPEVWRDPLEFMPERFLGKGVEFSVFGSDLRLAPFGSGRRTCPGKTLGLSTVTFWVARLLHEFEWLPSDDNEVDLTEVLRLSSEMANPLTVKVRTRRGLNLSKLS